MGFPVTFLRGCAPDGRTCVLCPSPSFRYSWCAVLARLLSSRGICASLQQVTDRLVPCSGWVLWDCEKMRTSAVLGVCPAPNEEEPACSYTLCWFNHSPKLAVTEARRDSTGRVLVMDTGCTTLAESIRFNSFVKETRAFVCCPNDAFLGGFIHRCHVLVVLRARDCQVLMQIRLTAAGNHPNLGGLSLFFSPGSQCLAVVLTQYEPEEQQSEVVLLWVVDLMARELTLSHRRPTPTMSGVHAWVTQGLIVTTGRGFGQHALHTLVCDNCPLLPGSDVELLPLEARALMRYAFDCDHVYGVHPQEAQTISIAVSPCSTWLAVLGGEGLSAWSVSVLRLATGARVAVFQAAYGPVEVGLSKSLWSLVWSRDCRRLVCTVELDTDRPAYAKTYVLALDG